MRDSPGAPSVLEALWHGRAFSSDFDPSGEEELAAALGSLAAGSLTKMILRGGSSRVGRVDGERVLARIKDALRSSNPNAVVSTLAR